MQTGFYKLNTIIPQQLVQKLSLLGLTHTCNWILDFLTERPRSGCVLSPLLFTLLTHNCTAKSESNLIIKFADDTTVVSLISNNNETLYREEMDQLRESEPPSSVHIYDNLTWTTNTSSVLKKAQQCLHFLRRLRRASLPPPILTFFYRGTVENVLTSCITAWFGNCSAQEHKTLQCVVRTAEKVIESSLSSMQYLFLTRCVRRASAITKDSSHPSHGLFDLLPSGKRFRSIRTCTTRFSNSFSPQAGAKEDPAQCKEPKFLGKAGWVKKAPGRLLASYKDRYIHVEKTEIVVYENEDLQNCLERVDLENYDKCHELKSPFKKKHRLILIRSPKSGNKVHDVKFQTQTAEEKEAWIKALSDGINRAKNKVFDEVKIDDSSNLEHVTRTRPKGNRNRRPPTRIHMKEVAVMSSDGILRLDLDLEDALMPNGTHHVSADGTDAPKEAIQASKPLSNASEAKEQHSGPNSEEEAQTEPEVSPQKKVIKPPMPPTKEAKPSATAEDEPDKDDGRVKEVLKPPMPPSKEAKPCVPSVEEATEKAKAEKTSEKSPDPKKKTGPPPTPPNKPSSSSSISNLTEGSQSRPNSHPPTPPSKEKKPFHQAVEPDQEVQGTNNEKKGKEDNKKEAKETAVETNEAEQSDSKEAPPIARDDEPESPSTQVQISESKSEETIRKSSDYEPQTPTEPLTKSPSPLPTPERRPEKLVQPDKQNIEDKTTIMHPTEGQDPTAILQTVSDTSASPPQEALPKSDVPSVVVSLNEPLTDSLSLSPLLCQLHGENKKEEEKSVDSGQHSDDDSEGSGSEDALAASTAALRGSHAGLDVLDASEDDIQVSVNLRPAQSATKSQVRSKVFPCRHSEPTPPLKPSAKARSASSGDLLSDSSVCVQVRQHTRAAAGNAGLPSDDVMKLEAEVALEMEKTSELLSRVSQSHGGGDREGAPEDLLTKAMEKLEKAEHVLREVKKLKVAKNRKSW
ncbi:uncharacterized protein plekho2 [Symphorus nematophorus]